MKKLFIVANWKANMTSHEADTWLEGFRINDLGLKNNDKEIIVCPPFTLLHTLKSYFLNHKSTAKLGGQDVSPFPKGAYTGEVAAEQLSEFATYVIIGHSERRKYFSENDQMLANKVDMAKDNLLTPIYCVQDVHTIIPKGVTLIAYEPIFAIGTGNPDTPENAEKVAKMIKQENKVQYVLYGGSVTDQNIASFTGMPSIDGVLVGSASLDPTTFSRIIKNV